MEAFSEFTEHMLDKEYDAALDALRTALGGAVADSRVKGLNTYLTKKLKTEKKQKIEEPASQAPHMAIAIETPGPAPALAPVATPVHQRQVQTTTPAGEWTNQLDAVSASQVSVVLPVAEPATSAPIVVEASGAIAR